ncbi:MAG: thioredoxin domain-containing protein [Candidatus Vogelbacteria bacterium]|nr:thioredoxin domain-containing protein [Candidatus Vogelbacteria bacterium]
MNENSKSSSYAIPGAIVVAGLIIAGAIYYQGPSTRIDSQPAAAGTDNQSAPLEKLRPIDTVDHLLGNPQAPIKIIEYSDLECPFCKTFHQTMHQLVTTYPNQVAWVYRHFPLDQLHAKARKEAEASECAYELGGPPGSETSNEKFWAYVDKVFEITPSNDGLDPAQLPVIAEQIGLNRQNFETCLASGRQAARVDADYQNAIETGGRGTPFPVVITPDGKKIALEGAIPFAGMKQLIDALLAEMTEK